MEVRLARIATLRGEIARNGRLIEAGGAGVIEAMALASARLAELARRADFAPPPWQPGLGEAIELKFSETRELTVRLQRVPAAPSGDRAGS